MPITACLDTIFPTLALGITYTNERLLLGDFGAFWCILIWIKGSKLDDLVFHTTRMAYLARYNRIFRPLHEMQCSQHNDHAFMCDISCVICDISCDISCVICDISCVISCDISCVHVWIYYILYILYIWGYPRVATTTCLCVQILVGRHGGSRGQQTAAHSCIFALDHTKKQSWKCDFMS